MTKNYQSTNYCRSILRIFLVLALLLSGCSIERRASLEVEEARALDEPVEAERARVLDESLDTQELPIAQKIMVNDLVSAFVQVMPPRTSTIQISSSNDDDLAQLVVKAMVHSGFGIQKVLTDQGPSLLSTKLRTEKRLNTNSLTTHIRFDIGQISIGRSYDVTSDQEVKPSSSYSIYGSRANIDYGSTSFGVMSAHNRTEYFAPNDLDASPPAISLIAPSIIDANDQGLSAQELTSFNSARVEIKNLHFGESTFGSLLDDRRLVGNLTLIFPNDSVVLGRDNKLRLRQFVKVFKERWDVVSVVGCSNGTTSVDIGNSGLALGRGERVTNELVSIGVPRRSILDQGCWAPKAGESNYPSRGVVVEIHRETA